MNDIGGNGYYDNDARAQRLVQLVRHLPAAGDTNVC